MTLHVDFQTSAKEKCVFCEPSAQLILHATEHFILMFDPFALIPGHLLMASQAHYSCLGEVPTELQEEGVKLRNLAYGYLDKAFKEPITRYEHGRAGHCLLQDSSTRSCHHYHEHFIPKHLSLHSALSSGFKYLSFREESEICALYERYNEYLLVEEPGIGKRFYIAKEKVIAPHLLRTLSACALGYSERQNWEDYDSCELMLQGKQQILSAIHGCNAHLNISNQMAVCE